MSTDGVIFEDISRTYCHFDRWTNLAWGDWDEVPDIEPLLEAYLRHIEKLIRHDREDTPHEGYATADQLRRLALATMQINAADGWYNEWSEEILRYAEAFPHGRFHMRTEINADGTGDCWDVQKSGDYTKWESEDMKAAWKAAGVQYRQSKCLS